MAKITAEDRILIKNLRIEKQWGVKRMITEFPNKSWSKTSPNRLCKQNDADGRPIIARKPGSGSPKSVRTVRNIRLVSELICSQENNPQRQKSPREIERETGISRRTIQLRGECSKMPTLRKIVIFFSVDCNRSICTQCKD